MHEVQFYAAIGAAILSEERAIARLFPNLFYPFFEYIYLIKTMIIPAKFIAVTDVRNVNFTNRNGEQKSLVAVSYQVQWLIYNEQGKSFTQELIAESLFNPDDATGVAVGPIEDDRLYDMHISFSVNKTKEGRLFNSVRLTRYSLHHDYE